MNKREQAQAERMLQRVGRIVTGRMIDGRTVGLSTDGDGVRAYFGTPKIFWSLDQVREYVAAHEPIDYNAVGA